jgi:hypothetical protein
LIPNELLVRVARTDYADAGLRSCSEHEFGRQTNWENLEPLEFMQRLAALRQGISVLLENMPATASIHRTKAADLLLARLISD